MKTNRSHCPVNYTLEVVGDKWTLLILRDMIFFNKSTYSDFKDSSEGIATNILANRLEFLECAGIVSKSKDPENSKINRYRLTEKGVSLTPLLIEMSAWGAAHDDQTQAPQEFIDWMKKDREGFTKAILEGVQDPSKNIFLKYFSDQKV